MIALVDFSSRQPSLEDLKSAKRGTHSDDLKPIWLIEDTLDRL